MKFLLILALAGALWWLIRRRPAPAMTAAEARALLDVPAGAGREEIAAAHRRLIAKVHPDAGGTPALAARINAARDVLIAERQP